MAYLKETTTDEITGKLDAAYWVQKSDPLVLMRSVPFTIGELKILDTYISRINASDDSKRTVIFTKEEYESLMDLSCVDYRTLKKHTEGMLGKVVTLEMPNKEYLQFVLFEQARYHKDKYGKPIITLTCSSLAKDLFFCIGKYHYFSYALENVTKLTRKSSYLLYIYIRTNRYRHIWEIDLSDLRDKVLDCKGQLSYQQYKIFKRDVLDKAVKELNDKTDCKVKYEPIKHGKYVVKIRFTIKTVAEKISENLDDLDGQLTFDETEPHDTDYGGELANLLGDVALDNEFTSEQVRIIQDLVLQAVPSNDNMKMCNYLISKVHLMNYYDSQNPIKKEKRFIYLKNMIENEIKDSQVGK